jgi:hypothetical protein
MPSLRFLVGAPSDWPLPIVWNCHGAATAETLALLDGVVDAWLPDYKYGNNACGRRLSGIDGYADAASRSIQAMLSQNVPVIVRLLVLAWPPGLLPPPGAGGSCKAFEREGSVDLDPGPILPRLAHQHARRSDDAPATAIRGCRGARACESAGFEVDSRVTTGTIHSLLRTRRGSYSPQRSASGFRRRTRPASSNGCTVPYGNKHLLT